MDSIHGINCDTYALALSNTSAAITFDKDYGVGDLYAVIHNCGTNNAFFTAGINSVPTAVFPTSPTVSTSGVVVPAGAIETYKLPPKATCISGIQDSSGGSGSAYISIGGGI